MSLQTHIQKLRHRLCRLERARDRTFFYKYIPIASTGSQELPVSLNQKLKRLWPFPLPLYYLWKWNNGLKYVDRQGKPVVCWTEMEDRDSIRRAATRLDKIFKARSLVPVLVTRIVDFPFFVRLGWQVEYLPSFSGKRKYATQKARYLALRYREAIVFPLEAGLENVGEISSALDQFLQP